MKIVVCIGTSLNGEYLENSSTLSLTAARAQLAAERVSLASKRGAQVKADGVSSKLEEKGITEVVERCDSMCESSEMALYVYT